MRRARVWAMVVGAAVAACGRGPSSAGTAPAEPAPVSAPQASATQALDLGAELDAAPAPRPIGPFEIAFAGKRNVYFATPPAPGKHRLIANLHGLCNPPGYACGYWTRAASERGFLVCPEGNTTCGAGGPPSWDESFADMDRDLEKSIDAVSARYDGEVSREGAILTGFSRGAWAAPAIAAMHPGRWRCLVLNEADVTLTKAGLARAGVEAVVLMAGEYGSQLAGERATAVRLQKEGVRAKLIVMPKAGHFYSANIDDLMKEALDFCVADEPS